MAFSVVDRDPLGRSRGDWAGTSQRDKEVWAQMREKRLLKRRKGPTCVRDTSVIRAWKSSAKMWGLPSTGTGSYREWKHCNSYQLRFHSSSALNIQALLMCGSICL